MEPVETLRKVINEKEIFFYFLKMKLSIFIWVGQSPATMKQLSVAMNLPSHTPSQTQLLGKGISSEMASRIAKKHKCQVFMSCNVEDPTLLADIEQCIKTHLENTSQDWLQLT